jgi:hypothetical protein
VNEARYRTEDHFGQWVCDLMIIFEFTGVGHALAPDGITSRVDQSCVIIGDLAGIDRGDRLLFG